MLEPKPENVMACRKPEFSRNELYSYLEFIKKNGIKVQKPVVIHSPMDQFVVTLADKVFIEDLEDFVGVRFYQEMEEKGYNVDNAIINFQTAALDGQELIWMGSNSAHTADRTPQWEGTTQTWVCNCNTEGYKIFLDPTVKLYKYGGNNYRFNMHDYYTTIPILIQNIVIHHIEMEYI